MNGEHTPYEAAEFLPMILEVGLLLLILSLVALVFYRRR